MGKEEFIKAITKLPKTESSNSLSSMHSINIDDLISAIERFNKIPTYDELLKENQKYKEVIDKITKCINEFPAIHYSSIEKVNNKQLSGKLIPTDELLDVLKEVE